MKLLVSACLLGNPCRYDGASKPREAVRALEERGFCLVPVCPEELGGLPTPRPPAELQGERVINREGRDVTAEYQAGARAAMEAYVRENCDAAVLKERSPSCGSGWVYDGTFSGRAVPGQGVTVRLLRERGIRVYSEEEIHRLLEELEDGSEPEKG